MNHAERRKTLSALNLQYLSCQKHAHAFTAYESRADFPQCYGKNVLQCEIAVTQMKHP